jgi:DNA (cytosine-5)-methyltransferase 1
MSIDIVDLFAGPGGLGEGFSSLDKGKAFKILVSAEMESSAHETLRLRSFYRLIRDDPSALSDYYNYCNGDAERPFTKKTEDRWILSGLEARRLTLGDPHDNSILDSILDEKISSERPWVLIGGPPCQAYSVVGRAKNGSMPNYRPENDHRHFLYKEYLRIIRERKPQIFVMENVLGLLSAKVSGQQIFHNILRDLADPDSTNSNQGDHPGYRIHSLVSDVFFETGMNPADIDLRSFVVRSENYGVPQARHRLILLGVRKDIEHDFVPLSRVTPVHVCDVIHDLPPLRSRVTKVKDSSSLWESEVKRHLEELANDAKRREMLLLENSLRRTSEKVRSGLGAGSLRLTKTIEPNKAPYAAEWYIDKNLKVWLNHEARSHMTSDLRRYAFAATHAALFDFSPTGHTGFILEGLAPNHNNWETGKFSDRFRVQRNNAPATTITSHIAKDGHYFIHPDPTQCRSLTVREAARLQTFPDNYFFQGTKTQQYHQVGNAVPPMLAKLIAKKVHAILIKNREREVVKDSQDQLSEKSIEDLTLLN